MAQIRYLFADCEEALQRGGCCPVGTVSPDFISLQNKLFVEPGPLYWLLLSSSTKTLTCRQSFLLLSKSSWQCTSNLKLPTLFKGKMWISFSTSWLIFTLQLFSFLSFCILWASLKTFHLLLSCLVHHPSSNLCNSQTNETLQCCSSSNVLLNATLKASQSSQIPG